MKLNLGDSLDILKECDANSVDSIVTDPPYGLSFMGKKWDYDVPSKEIWAECLRVLKPGGYMLAACGTRTQHRMATSIEEAGFEIRDVISWLYAQGFPKSLNIKKAAIKEGIACGCETKSEHELRPVSDADISQEFSNNKTSRQVLQSSMPKQSTRCSNCQKPIFSEGLGSALKPACEFWTLARKPLSESTLAKNVLKHGTGGINVGDTRIGTESIVINGKSNDNMFAGNFANHVENPERVGRFPSNAIFDEDAATVLDGQAVSAVSRFFYIPKVSSKERGESTHPTMKPIKLMEYLIKLITPAGGIVLDPFMGSGTTGVAAQKLGFDFFGIEIDPGYFEIASKRINDSVSDKQTNIIEGVSK